MRRVGMYVDVSNLYFCLGNNHQKKLNYGLLRDFVSSFGTLVKAVAYGAKINRQADRFIAVLKRLGYTPKYKEVKQFGSGKHVQRKADWDVGIAIDIVRDILADEVDFIVLCCADSDLEPVVTWAREQGVDVIILASRVSRELKAAATKWIEIPNSLFEGIDFASTKHAGK